MAMRGSKKFDYKQGKFYFNVKSMVGPPITINRSSKEEAIEAFSRYLRAGKDCEWLGQWEGKKFSSTDFEKQLAKLK